MFKKPFFPAHFMKSVPAFKHRVSADPVSTTRKIMYMAAVDA